MHYVRDLPQAKLNSELNLGFVCLVF